MRLHCHIYICGKCGHVCWWRLWYLWTAVVLLQCGLAWYSLLRGILSHSHRDGYRNCAHYCSTDCKLVARHIRGRIESPKPGCYQQKSKHQGHACLHCSEAICINKSRVEVSAASHASRGVTAPVVSTIKVTSPRSSLWTTGNTEFHTA